MLSSLQDVQGLFPGLFRRGQSEAAAEQAARQAQQNGRADVGHGKDRDSLDLSPEARDLKGAAERAVRDENEAAGNPAAAENASKSLLGEGGGFVRQALETIRHDLGKALKAFGFENKAVQNFTKAFIEPVLNALKEGVNFTAELSFAAFSQVTATSSNGDFSQSTSLVAQSLSIEVNQDTGEVNVSLAKLSFEQNVRSVGGAAEGQQPLLVLDPEDLATPQELAAKILASGEAAAKTAQPAETPEDGETAPVAEVEGGEGEVATEELEQSLTAMREKLAEDAMELQTRLTIYSVSTHKNDKGETITKLLLDAQLRISSLAEGAPVEEEAESLNLTA